MSKYSVYYLKVVKVGKGDDAFYFICRPSLDPDVYIEIFTKEKIKVKDDSCVEPLCNWYSILTQCNYVTGEPLMLTKERLLRKYIEINNYYAEKRVEEKKTFVKKKRKK